MALLGITASFNFDNWFNVSLLTKMMKIIVSQTSFDFLLVSLLVFISNILG